jgi:hypothetical protein
MNKFNVLIVIFAVIGFMAYRNLKKTYKRFEKKDSQELKESLTLPSDKVSVEDSRIFYYINVDRFIDGKKDNNSNINIVDNNAFHGGDVIGIVGALDYLSKLGVTDIVLSPLNQQVTTPLSRVEIQNQEFDVVPFSGMYSENVDQMDPRFGTFDDLTTLINEANKKNILIHMAYNLNSVHQDSLMIYAPKTKIFFREDAGKCPNDLSPASNCNMPYAVDFNQNITETNKYLVDVANTVWLSRGLKGLFLLEGRGYEQAFLKQLNDENTKSRGKDYLQTIIYNKLDGFKLRQYLEKDLLTHIYAANFPEILSEFVLGNTSLRDFNIYLYQLINQDISHNIILPISRYNKSFHSFINTDIKLFERALAIVFTLGASPMFVDGDEFGVMRNPTEISDFPWGNNNVQPGKGKSQNIEAFKIFNKYSALYQKYYQNFVGQYNSIILSVAGVYCFEKRIIKSESEYTTNSLTCMNLTDAEKSLQLGGITSNWTQALEILKNQKEPLDQGILNVNLAPNEIKIFVPSN